MSNLVRRDERGMTTAEYAVGTLATVSFAGVLLKVLTDPQVLELIMKIITWILGLVFGWAK